MELTKGCSHFEHILHNVDFPSHFEHGPHLWTSPTCRIPASFIFVAFATFAPPTCATARSSLAASSFSLAPSSFSLAPSSFSLPLQSQTWRPCERLLAVCEQQQQQLLAARKELLPSCALCQRAAAAFCEELQEQMSGPCFDAGVLLSRAVATEGVNPPIYI